MFDFFQTTFHTISIVIATALLTVTGFFAPAQQVSPPLTPPPQLEQKQPEQIPQKTPTQKNAVSPKTQGSFQTTKTAQPIGLSNSEIIKKIKPAVVFIQTSTEAGSGFIIESSGIILTNAHVVHGADSATVKLSDGRVYDGSIMGRNENIDLALIKINANNLIAAELGNSDQLAQGDSVYALGYPFGLEGDVSFKEGILSRRLTNESNTYLETSVEIHPGNSGGPLVNVYGRVVGINTETIGLNLLGMTIGETLKLAIPINTANIYINQLKAGQSITKSTQPLPSISSLISLNDLCNNFQQYFHTKVTTQGAVIDLQPANDLFGNTVVIKDGNCTAYVPVDTNTWSGLSLGNQVKVVGILTGPASNTSVSFRDNDNTVSVIGQSSNVPSTQYVFSQTQIILQTHNADIQNAINSASAASSFDSCMSVEREIWDEVCAAANLGKSCILHAYLDSVSAINNATKQLLNTCTPKLFQ